MNFKESPQAREMTAGGAYLAFHKAVSELAPERRTQRLPLPINTWKQVGRGGILGEGESPRCPNFTHPLQVEDCADHGPLGADVFQPPHRLAREAPVLFDHAEDGLHDDFPFPQ
jgi:hypothetical protein